MKGDFSRRSFDPEKRYSAVLQEQGRMLTDADLDEEHRILAHHIERAAADLIGGCGAPLGAAGLALTQAGAEYEIGAGRFYADGILVENAAAVAFGSQPHRPGVAWPPPGAGAGRHLAYLDVWRRLVTALDDPLIREAALGGPTTAAREQTVWQVRAVSVPDTATCSGPLPDVASTTGRMAARADPEDDVTDPCEVPPSAGFKGLENQFYRVEVHDDGDAYDLAAAPDVFEIAGFPAGTTHQATMVAAGDLAPGEAVELFAQATPLKSTLAHIVAVDGNDITLSRALPSFATADLPRLRRVGASFVWSRENGSVVAAVERIDGTTLTVSDLGRDEVLGFAPGQWVELTDDRNEYEQQRGQLLRIASIDAVGRQIVVETAVTPLDAGAAAGVNRAWHPKLRRWEGAGAIRVGGAGPDGDWVHLEDGVQVRFEAGRYRTGDYWHFPARTATIDPELGTIEWPRDGAGVPALLPPHGVVHHVCPLALVDLADPGDGSLAVVGAITDCRDLFPPVTELTNLLYLGGDAQERILGAPGPLELPLQARVANGSHPVAGATVRFAIAQGNGQLQGGAATADVVTDAQGVAACAWSVDGATPVQRCEARLLDAAGDPIEHQALNFHARLARRGEAGGRSCCVSVGEGGEFSDIREAIEALRGQGQRTLCLRLLPGDHDLPGLGFSSREPERPESLTIGGCAWGSRLNVQDDLHVEGLAGFGLHDLDVVVREGATIVARQCREVRIDRCRISGIHERVGVVRIHGSSHIYVGNSIFEAFIVSELIEARNFLDGLQDIEGLYSLGDWRDFERQAREAALRLAGADAGHRAHLADDLRSRLGHFDLSRGEAHAYRRLAEALAQPDPGPLALLDHLIAIRHAVLRLDPGVALEIGELVRGQEGELSPAGTRAGAVAIEHNDITGLVSFYGIPDRHSDFDLGTTLERLFGLLRERVLTLDGFDAGVHVHDNRLTRLVIGSEMMRHLEELSDRGGSLEPLIASFHCTDNVVDGAISQFVAYHQALTSNEFSLSALRFRRGQQVAQRVADVVASSAVYTGNHAQSRGFDSFIHAQLVNATGTHAEAANLELEIVFN